MPYSGLAGIALKGTIGRFNRAFPHLNDGPLLLIQILCADLNYSATFVSLETWGKRLNNTQVMTDKQIQMVQRSWRLVRSIDPVLMGDVFYTRLFMMSPPLRHMFRGDMEAQSKKLMDMISMVIARLDRLDSILPEITASGRRHREYGAKPQHYVLIGKALVWTLQKALAGEWNHELEEAWVTCYNELADMMKEASGEVPKPGLQFRHH